MTPSPDQPLRPKTVRHVLPAGVVAAFSLAILTFLAFLPSPESPAQAACGTALPTGKGLVTMTMNAPSSSTYRVWVRMLAPSAGVDGFYLQIPDASVCNVTMANGGVTVNSWTWVDYQNGSTGSKVNATLSAGNHQVQLSGLDDGVLIDKVLLLSDATCTPAGDGANCTAAASTPSPTPGSGSTPAPTPTVVPISNGTSAKPTTVSNTISIPVPANLTNTKCSVDGKTVDCASVDTKNLSDGEHVVTVTGLDKDGKPIEQSTTIKVKNKTTLLDRVVAGMQKYRLPLIILGVLVVTAPLAWYLSRRFGLLDRLHPHPGMSGGSPMPPTPSAPSAPATPTAPTAPPSSNLVFPTNAAGPAAGPTAGPQDPTKPL